MLKIHTGRRRRNGWATLMSLVAVLSVAVTLAPARPYTPSASAAPLSPAPTSVTIAGDLQTALGCANNWDPTCAATHLTYDANDDVWQGTFNVPAGSWNYKAALNDSWNENYGLHAQPGGANIPLNLASATSVKFYYSHNTHWVTDNQGSVIATVPGSYQQALGCSDNWDPGCLRSWLQDPDGDGTYYFETTSIPHGSYEAKVAINESWNENYGQGGVQNGANIPFTVPVDGALVRFSYNPTSHVLTILAGHAHDNNVEWNGLRHDSRDTLYRTPGGAVPAGTPVTIRFRTFHNDVTSVTLRAYDVNAGAEHFYGMQLAASDVSCYQAGLESETCDYWAYTLNWPSPDNFWYRFIIKDGTSTAYYADNTPALDGGLGAPTSNIVDQSYALMFYDGNFQAPSWVKSGVIYQIFPDRFRNGRANNDPHTGDVRYDPSQSVIKLPWLTLPEGFCKAYTDANTNCPWRFSPHPNTPVEQPQGRDYMGGDLKGVDQELDYLQSIGVNTIYFNPIFDSGSNHGYDTQNYLQIDPYFGTQQDWDNLAKHTQQRGMRLVLDGVFNHMSSDSPFFDRYHHYATVGACESVSSPYRNWFTFQDAPNGGPCAGPNGPNTMTYNGWAGFDSIPVLNKSNPAVQTYFYNSPNGVAETWLNQGADGWRLDVMGDPSFPSNYWTTFRTKVKQTDPNAVIIGELWQKDSTLLSFLRGDRADSTMNYRLRDAVVGLLAPGPFDAKGFADSGYPLSPSQFAARIQSMREDYPDAAYYSMMNLLDSHDTARALWTLTPGQNNQADKEQNAANVAQGKEALRLASLVQFTMPGAPTVYYGDEVGMTGNDDPDTRRTYPWADLGGSPDNSMLAHYQTLSQKRNALPSLVNGDLRVLVADDQADTVAYGRKTGSQASLVAVNKSNATQTVTIPLSGYIPDGITFSVSYAVGNSSSGSRTVNNGSIQLTLNPLSGVLLATSNGVDLTPPAAPAGLNVTNEGNGQVSLSWNSVNGAANYNVYRSPVSGGGWVKANGSPVTGTSFTDTGLRNARTYYYTVRALDATGNESGPSSEVNALPHYTIGWANTQWPPSMTHTISVVTPTDNVYGQVYIAGVTNLPGPTDSLTPQLGFGPAGTAPTSQSWTWIDATFNTDAGNNDEYKATMLPDAVGTYNYAYRYSTTNGRDWLYTDLSGPVANPNVPLGNPGVLTVTPSGDTTAPATPTGLHVTGSSPASIELAWDAVTGDPTMYGYEVLRSATSGGPYTMVARVTTNSYSDTTVNQGSTYYYVVRSVDQSFNRSGNSSEVVATAALRTVSVTFNVTVPASTDGTGRPVHIAGTLSLLNGGLPDWDPTAAAMTRVDATHWTITLTGLESTQIQYKYVLGDWNYVEKDGSCGEIANRQLTLTYGSNGQQVVNDTVQNWRNVSPCGN